MKTFLKIILIIGGFLLLFLGAAALTGYFYFGFNKDLDGLKANYEKNGKEIWAIKDYLSSVLPQGAIVHVEFENDDLNIFHVRVDSTFESNWDLKLHSRKTDSLLTELGWTEATLLTLKEKLEDADCISVASRKPITIGWQRSGMGMYSYNLFDQQLNDSLLEIYDDNCMYIPYKDNVVLEYGSGAFGSFCFPELR